MNDDENRSPRVLHVVESLHRGAVESWLVRMLRHGRNHKQEMDWSFYCQLDSRGELEDEVRDLGGHIIHSPTPIAEKWRFIRALRRHLQSGRYDVLHCHHDLVNAVYLLAAADLPLKRRISHVHNADESVLTPSKHKQRLLREPMRQACLAMADRIVAISNHTLDRFLAGRPRRPGRDSVHYYGIDAAPFVTARADKIAFRREHGLSDDALILLFAGRLVPEKNPVFAVDVLASLRRAEPRAVLVFAGSGSEEQLVRRRAFELDVEASTKLFGWRNDLPELMTCSDWFILPRPEEPMEGFGLAVVEAQLAGLKLLLSQGIADDPLLPNYCGIRLSLSEGPVAWARAGIGLLSRKAPDREKVAEALAMSPFDMNFALDDLLALHA